MKTSKMKTFSLVLLFIFFFSAISWGQVLVVYPQNEPHEGGEIQLKRAGNHNGWRIDNYKGTLRFHHDGAEYFRMKANGNLGIGTANPVVKLAVDGTIRAKKVKVSTNIWSDYVFKKEYVLPTLEEVAHHIAANGHLKDIPSAAEVVKEGIDLGAMDAKLLAKIEELTLYAIQQQKEIQAQNEKIKILQEGLEELLKK